jgi:hypothetical protein
MSEIIDIDEIWYWGKGDSTLKTVRVTQEQENDI